MKKISLIFLSTFLLNWIWENLHSILYAGYKGGEITQLILLRAAAFDAIFITLLAALFLKISYLRKRLWLAFIFGVVAAIIIELYALETGRWAYNASMPVIPFLRTGLTPTFQLGILSYLILLFIRPDKET